MFCKGRYQIVSAVGRGVFSSVLCAKETHRFDADVAIKVIRSNDVMTKLGQKELSLLEELRPALSKEEWDKIIHSSPPSAESTMRIFDTCAEWVEQKYMPSATAEIRTKVSHAIIIMLVIHCA